MMNKKQNKEVVNVSQVSGFNQQWLMEMKLLQKKSETTKIG